MAPVDIHIPLAVWLSPATSTTGVVIWWISSRPGWHTPWPPVNSSVMASKNSRDFFAPNTPSGPYSHRASGSHQANSSRPILSIWPPVW